GTPADPAMADSMAVRDTLAADSLAADSLAVQQPVYVQKPMTIFNPDRFKVVRGERQSLVLRSRTEAVRAGDYLQAPFLADMDGVENTGHIAATISSDAVGMTLSKRSIQPYDRIYVDVPAGAAGERDERFMSFR